ncbi:MAG: hypothetical protein ABJM12_00870, partial [Ekhidna sp.]
LFFLSLVLLSFVILVLRFLSGLRVTANFIRTLASFTGNVLNQSIIAIPHNFLALKNRFATSIHIIITNASRSFSINRGFRRTTVNRVLA